MKPASPAMIALLAENQNLFTAELVTLTLDDGTIFRWTTSPTNITFSAQIYTSRKMDIGNIAWRNGIEVDVLKMQLYAEAANTIESNLLLQAAQQGLIDNALVLIQRLFTNVWGDWSAGSVILFKGNVSDMTIDQAHVEFDIKSRKELFNIPFPYITYQPACQWELYGPGCTLNANSFRYSGAIAAGSVPLLLNTTLTNPDGAFDQGYIVFTSGVNNGVKRAVRQYVNASGQILLFVPLPAQPGNGDTFYAFLGCDKKQSTCDSKFSNLFNFLGRPYIPIPETSV